MPLQPRHRLIVCLAIFGAAFTATHLPPGKIQRLPRSDKLLHFAGFVVLGIVATWQGQRPGHRPTIGRAAIVLLVVAAYAAIDELTQPLAGRSCELLDWAADAAGAAAGVGLMHWRLVHGVKHHQ